MAYRKHRILQAIVASTALYFLPVLSSSVYAMGGCPEACNNQLTNENNACTDYGCHKGKGKHDVYFSCKWRKHVKAGKPQCVPDYSKPGTDPDTSGEKTN